MPDYQIEIKSVQPQMIACIRDVIADYQSIGPLYEELMVGIDKHGLEIAGPALGIYYDEGYRPKNVEAEVAMPVLAKEDISGARFSVRELDGHETMASLLRVGPWNDFSGAYRALMEWIQAEGWRIVGPNREIYLKGPESGAESTEFVVELQFPVIRRD